MKMSSLIRFERGEMFPQKPFSTARMLGKTVFVNKGSGIVFESCLPAIEVGAVFRNLAERLHFLGACTDNLGVIC